MNKNEILSEVGDFAKVINNSLDKKSSREFNVRLKTSISYILSNNYSFLQDIIDVSHRKKLTIPKAMRDFLTYDEDLRKDIIYTFLLNSEIKRNNK